MGNPTTCPSINFRPSTVNRGPGLSKLTSLAKFLPPDPLVASLRIRGFIDTEQFPEDGPTSNLPKEPSSNEGPEMQHEVGIEPGWWPFTFLPLQIPSTELPTLHSFSS